MICIGCGEPFSTKLCLYDDFPYCKGCYDSLLAQRKVKKYEDPADELMRRMIQDDKETP